jgi:adenine-specific DNA-methyltransferase
MDMICSGWSNRKRKRRFLMHLARRSTESGLLDYSAALQERHEAATSADARKEKGQVFTPPAVCRFMASRFTRIPESFRVLDPGAGIGSLSAAICERVMTLASPRHIEIVLFENDAVLLPLLEQNLRHCQMSLRAAEHELRYTIHAEDFILGTRGRRPQGMLFDDGEVLDEFDAVIANPPYFKIGADSAHGLAMGDVFQGQTNIYMLFMARAAELLKSNGELVAITPRSFCNGLYFRNFRRWFFSRMALRHVHLFECRRSTFDNVLQESVITQTQRLGIATPTTTITTSLGRDIPLRPEELTLPAGKILDDTSGDMVVRIPATAEDAAIMEAVESWPDRFAELGLQVSTGPVVLFRAGEFLLSKPDGKETAPLIGPHNVRPFETVWPLEKRGKPMAFRVCAASMKHLVPTRNYVLLRRFSAKEERRRLTASWFLHAAVGGPYLALENHINYVYHANRELTVDEVYGLTALFNSALLDGYFRIISGNTQVNATEIRSIRFPTLDLVKSIGGRVKKLGSYPPAGVERIVLDSLGIQHQVRRHGCLQQGVSAKHREPALIFGCRPLGEKTGKSGQAC